jgi:hypothetical protein
MLQFSELPPVTKFDQSMAGLMIVDTQHDPLCNFGQTAPLTNTVEPEASVGTECPKGVIRDRLEPAPSPAMSAMPR